MIPFELNSYSVLLLPAFIQGLLFAGLTLFRFIKQRQLHDLLLLVLLLLLTIRLSFWMLGFAGWYDTHDVFTSFMFYFPFNTLAFIGPCLYFYFLSLTRRDFNFDSSFSPHLVLPALIIVLYIGKFVIDFAFFRPFLKTEAYQFGTHGPTAQWDKTDIVYLLSYASLMFYVLLVLREFKHYKNYLVENFSNPDHIDLKWLKRLLLFTAIIISVMFIFYLLSYFAPNTSYSFNWYPYFLLGIIIYYVSINAYYNGPELFRFLHVGLVAIKYDIANEHTKIEEWKLKLNNLLAEKQLFLDAELSLVVLAKSLQTNPHLLSKVINEGFGLNFNDYINQHRVDAVIGELKNNAHHKFSLMGIAYDCGFNSKTTFNRAFKKATGKSPSDYIEKLEGSNDKMNP